MGYAINEQFGFWSPVLPKPFNSSKIAAVSWYLPAFEELRFAGVELFLNHLCSASEYPQGWCGILEIPTGFGISGLLVFHADLLFLDKNWRWIEPRISYLMSLHTCSTFPPPCQVFLVGAQRSLFERKNYLLHTFLQEMLLWGPGLKIERREEHFQHPRCCGKGNPDHFRHIFHNSEENPFVPLVQGIPHPPASPDRTFPQHNQPSAPQNTEEWEMNSQELLFQLVWLSPFPQHTHHEFQSLWVQISPGGSGFEVWFAAVNSVLRSRMF